MKEIIKKKITQGDNLAQFKKKDIVLVIESLYKEIRFYFETKESYDELWRELCEDKNIIGIDKITVCQYRKPIKSFEEAKEACNIKAKELGGVWHVVNIGERYNYVSDYYVKKNKTNSIYKVNHENEIR